MRGGGGGTRDNIMCFCFRYMFIATIGAKDNVMFPTNIQRAYMDGSSREYVVNDKIMAPMGLTLDYANQRIYWTDAHMNHIESVKYSGQDR